MSSRQLRKLQKQKELNRASPQDVEESDDAEETSPTAGTPRINLFAALGGSDEQDDEELEEEQDNSPGLTPIETPTPKSGKKSKKKKKKAKKSKAAEMTAELEPDGEDEIDRAMKELNIQPEHSEESSVNQNSRLLSQADSILTINLYHLKAVNEMRNLFGRDVMEAVAAEEEQQHRVPERRTAQQQVDLETFLREPPNTKKLPEVSLRRNIFIQGRDHWPLRTTGGLSMMEIKKASDGSWTEYAYTYNREYDQTQAIFFACVQIGDPMRMVHLLKSFPYQVSTLLQVSSVAKQDQNMALAAELCERALFTFGRVATSAFRRHLEQGQARLDFKRPENRQFWLAGYHYLKSLIRKGTYRTALEWAKLLFSLDPEDPYGIRHFIHPLAIRAYEARWLLAFLDRVEKISGKKDTMYIRETRVLAHLQLGNVEQARQDLADGMARLPWLYCCLFQDLNLDTPPSIWGISAVTDARVFWVELYLLQTKGLWDSSQATALLLDVANSLSRNNLEELPKTDPPVDLGSTRLAYLEGVPALLERTPRDLLDSQPNYESDPLPPPEAENVFSNESTRLPWVNQRGGDDQQAPGQLGNILAQMQQMLANRGRPPAAGTPQQGEAEGMLNFEDVEEINTEDEELQRDIATQLAGNVEPGLVAGFLQMFGITANRSEAGGAEDGSEETGDLDRLPGAWPAEEDQQSERNSGR